MREARAQRGAGGLRGSKQNWVGKATVASRVGIIVPTGTPVKLGKLVIKSKDHGVKQCSFQPSPCLLGLCFLICKVGLIPPGKVFVGIKQTQDTLASVWGLL